MIRRSTAGLVVIAATTSLVAIGCTSSGGKSQTLPTNQATTQAPSQPPSEPPSQPGTPVSEPPSAPSSAGGVDPCLVGSWKSTATMGSTDINGVTVDFTGGDGALLTVTAAGQTTDDYSNANPLQGQGSDGSTYKVVSQGTLSGTITASDGNASITYDENGFSQVLSKDDQPMETDTPPSEAQSGTYTCSDTQLTVNSNGLATTYDKVSS